ncbi:hypothetical protein QTO34_006345 [Cnephaeus nilssonii]|uniref:Uncharacterized protein n=1 Tax=Cnephaeus nilssonii TaxID=3371016 RepID=A0AA40HKC1_CNENI|nr:hypothetical protein QTO34_006345 [Eptesicus nilssonii]
MQSFIEKLEAWCMKLCTGMSRLAGAWPQMLTVPLGRTTLGAVLLPRWRLHLGPESLKRTLRGQSASLTSPGAIIIINLLTASAGPCSLSFVRKVVWMVVLLFGEGIPRQVLGMEAMGAYATKETELNLTSPCLAPEDGWLARDDLGHCNHVNRRHVSSLLLSKEQQTREQPATGLRTAASRGLPLSKEQQLWEQPAPQQPHNQPTPIQGTAAIQAASPTSQRRHDCCKQHPPEEPLPTEKQLLLPDCLQLPSPAVTHFLCWDLPPLRCVEPRNAQVSPSGAASGPRICCACGHLVVAIFHCGDVMKEIKAPDCAEPQLRLH